ncbi:MAG: methylmalonyl Co-A mutase-associated GTPase MeaB [Rikenellaceae bacterium]
MKHFEDLYKQSNESALSVSRGVEQPPVVNPHFKKRPRRSFTPDQYVEGILRGDITILSQAITLVESLLPEHHELSQQIIERCLPHCSSSMRIGITGVPGAGKSTFIEAVGDMVTAGGHKLAVLAIDPSSQRSSGSILGDKTRMESLVHNKSVFIRPSPSAGSLGGVARKTRESIVLCEAAGFDIIFIETVGVGQSEIAVHSMTDLFLMLQISGAGDELQGIKRGIMEMADIISVTKADGSNVEKAQVTAQQFINALSLFPMPDSMIRPEVFTCSSTTGDGLKDVWQAIETHIRCSKENGYFDKNRSRQSLYWLQQTIDEALHARFYNHPKVVAEIEGYKQAILDNNISSFAAAAGLLKLTE